MRNICIAVASALLILSAAFSAGAFQDLGFYDPLPSDEPLSVGFNDPPDLTTTTYPNGDDAVVGEVNFKDQNTSPAYLALIIPDPPRSANPFPFSSTGSGEQLGYSITPAPSRSALSAAVANSPAKLMPFPQRLPFAPVAGGTGSGPTRACDTLNPVKMIFVEPLQNRIAFYDTCTRRITSRMQVGTFPIGLGFIADSTSALVSNMDAGNLSLVDIVGQRVLATIALPNVGGQPAAPNAIAVSPDGTRAYVTHHSDAPGAVFVVDIPGRRVIATINVGQFPAAIAMTPDGSQVWVPARASNNVTVIDTLANQAMFTIGGVELATGVDFNPMGTRAFVAAGREDNNGSLQVFDTKNFARLADIRTGNLPFAVRVTPSGRHVFVSNLLSSNIVQIDARTYRIVRTIPTGRYPSGITFLNTTY